MNGIALALLGAAAVIALAWPWIRRRGGAATTRESGIGKRGVRNTPPGPADREPKPDALSVRRAGRAADDRATEALEEIEFDHETGKLTDEDYRQLRAKYERERAAHAVRESSVEPPPPGRAAAKVPPVVPPSPLAVRRDLDDVAEELVRRARQTHYRCPVCGPRPEPDARFCSSCGRFIQPCPGCGREISEPGSRFCAVCGAVLSRDLVSA